MSQKEIKVIAVVGLGYSGSTLLSLMFGSHPKIYGGGELHWLLEKKKGRPNFKVECTVCGENCKYWTPRALDSVPAKGFYYYIGKLFNKRIIVDASKMYPFFEKRHSLEPDIQFIYVILVKHPIRHLSSYVTNFRGWQKIIHKKYMRSVYKMFFDSQKRNHKELTRMLFRRNKKRYMDINSLILELDADYSCLTQNIYRLSLNHFCYLIQYERLVLDPSSTLSPLLRYCGLDYTSSMENCYDYEHHQIGGNGDAIYQITKKWSLEYGEKEADINPIRRKEYENKSGIFLDNKFSNVFSPHELDWLRNHKQIIRLSRMLGYDPDIKIE